MTRSFTLTVVINGVWTHGTGQTDANDPAPTSIWLVETSTSEWAGSYISGGIRYAGTNTAAVDGLSSPTDPPVNTVVNGVITAAVVSSSNAPVQTAPPAHWFKQPVTGGSFTLTRTFSGSATVTTPAHSSASYTIGAIFDGYTVSIHAQPYNFHQTSVTDNGNGTLTFNYWWLSTDGSLSDLDPSCLVHEYVAYQGGNPYAPPLPFTGTSPNPTITPSPYEKGSVGAITDNQFFWSVTTPYTANSFTATQTWEFDDSAIGQVNQPIPGPDSGPLSITRTVGSRIPYIGSWYSVTKNGTTAWASLGN